MTAPNLVKSLSYPFLFVHGLNVAHTDPLSGFFSISVISSSDRVRSWIWFWLSTGPYGPPKILQFFFYTIDICRNVLRAQYIFLWGPIGDCRTYSTQPLNRFDGPPKYATNAMHCHYTALWNHPTCMRVTYTACEPNFLCSQVHNLNKMPMLAANPLL